MDAAQYQRRAEVGAARRRHVEWHFRNGGVDDGVGVAGIDQTCVGIVIGEQQGDEPRSPSFGIGPADNHEFLAVEGFDLAPQPVIAGTYCALPRFEAIPSEDIKLAFSWNRSGRGHTSHAFAWWGYCPATANLPTRGTASIERSGRIQ